MNPTSDKPHIGSNSSDWSNSAATYSSKIARLPMHYAAIAQGFFKFEEKDEQTVFLDVAAGPGHLGKQIAQRLHELHKGDTGKYKVYITDFAEGMLNAARNSLTASPELNVSVQRADGQNLEDFATNSVSALSCIWGIMFMPDYQQSVNEMFRVLKPGGMAVVGTWHKNQFFDVLVGFGRQLGTLGPDEVPSSIKILEIGNTPAVLNSYFEKAGFLPQNCSSEIYSHREEFPDDSLGALFDIIVQNPVLQLPILPKHNGGRGKEPTTEDFRAFIKSDAAKHLRNERDQLELGFHSVLGQAVKQ